MGDMRHMFCGGTGGIAGSESGVAGSESGGARVWGLGDGRGWGVGASQRAGVSLLPQLGVFGNVGLTRRLVARVARSQLREGCRTEAPYAVTGVSLDALLRNWNKEIAD